MDLLFGIGPKDVCSDPPLVERRGLPHEAAAVEVGSLLDSGNSVISVEWFTSRRPVALIRFSSDDCCIVKFAARGESGCEGLRREAAALKGLEGLLPVLRKDCLLVPRLLLQNDACIAVSWLDGNCLCFEELSDGFGVGKLIGRALAAVHRLGSSTILSGGELQDAPFPVPQKDFFTVSDYRRGIGVEFPLLFSAYQECSDCFDRLRSDWRRGHFIHGDLRRENIMVGSDGGLRLIDWETAGLGNGFYDLGLVLCELVRYVLDARIRSRGPSVSWIGFAKGLLESYCNWSGYSYDQAGVSMIEHASVALYLRTVEKDVVSGRLGKGDILTLSVMKNFSFSPKSVLRSFS